jgi:hypothetical protein
MLIGLATGVNEMVRRRVGFGSAAYIRRIIHEHRIYRHRSGKTTFQLNCTTK